MYGFFPDLDLKNLTCPGTDILKYGSRLKNPEQSREKQEQFLAAKFISII